MTFKWVTFFRSSGSACNLYIFWDWWWILGIQIWWAGEGMGQGRGGMEPKLAKQLANPMLVRRGKLWPVQDGERGRGGAWHSRESTQTLQWTVPARSNWWPPKRVQPQTITYKSLKSHLKCVPLLPYPFWGTVNISTNMVVASSRWDLDMCSFEI